MRARSKTITACAVGLAILLGLSAAPVAAETDGFVTAESARLARHKATAQVGPPSTAIRAQLYAERATLKAELDLARFALNHHATQWVEFVEVHQRLQRHITALNAVDRKIDGVDRKIDRVVADIEQLEDDIASIETALTDRALLEEFGLEFAVFPIEETTEFINSWGAARSGGRGHKGTDILGPHGTEVRAIEDGVIERTTNSSLGGLSLYLQGDSGARYFYAHLSAFNGLDDGTRVYAGDVIGFNGDSGNARGTPHLHFQWAPDGGESWRNPYAVLEAIWTQDRQVPLPRR